MERQRFVEDVIEIRNSNDEDGQDDDEKDDGPTKEGDDAEGDEDENERVDEKLLGKWTNATMPHPTCTFTKLGDRTICMMDTQKAEDKVYRVVS